MENYSLFMWREPTARQEDAYNDWYDNVHLKEVCASPGSHRGDALRFFERDANAPQISRYLQYLDERADNHHGPVDRSGGRNVPLTGAGLQQHHPERGAQDLKALLE